MPLDADAIRATLPAGAVIGRAVQVFAEVDSTNDVVTRAGRLGAEEGLTVFAESQRAGRGRQGRRWSSAPGLGLWFSVLLRPPRGTAGPMALLAAAAVARAVEETVGQPVGVKWPNDVLLDGRKVAGVLIETTDGLVVVGVGVNANHRAEDFPPELRSRAGSLALSLGRPVDRVALAGRLLAHLDGFYRRWPGNTPDVVATCESRNVLRGRRVRAAGGDFTGTVLRFAPDGGLVLRGENSGEERTVYAGEVLAL